MKSILVFLLLTQITAWAQPATLDVGSAEPGGYGTVKFNDNSALGRKSNAKIDYSEVRGKYFWNSNWDSAAMTLKSNNQVKVQRAKLNMYTDEVHYMDKSGVELVAQPGQVKLITFYDNDKPIGVFELMANYGDAPGDGFHQILNAGKLQLAKKTTVTLKKKNYDPSVGKAEYGFVSTTRYFIKEGNTTTLIKKLTKDSFTSLVQLNENELKWLAGSGNKLKSENDFISALEYINTNRN